MSVADNFLTFCSNILISTDKRSSIGNRYGLMIQRLNIDFWDESSKTKNSRYVGSYGRGTAIKGFSDLDMIFILPYGVYKRINDNIGNGQAALLQEVRNSLKKTYNSTHIGADGQVVAINFDDDISFEIVPVFINKDDSYTYPDSNDGGSWKVTNPVPEIKAVADMDEKCNNNLKRLCKMMRAWKNKWSVPMGGLLIDTLAHSFIKNWGHRDKSYLYYDFISRDFFKYISEQDKDKSYWLAVGSNQRVYRKGLFEAKAKKCYNLSLEAIQCESDEYSYSAKSKWREIYGTKFPS